MVGWIYSVGELVMFLLNQVNLIVIIKPLLIGALIRLVMTHLIHGVPYLMMSGGIFSTIAQMHNPYLH